jgi:hypothetical protein
MSRWVRENPTLVIWAGLQIAVLVVLTLLDAPKEMRLATLLFPPFAVASPDEAATKAAARKVVVIDSTHPFHGVLTTTRDPLEALSQLPIQADEQALLRVSSQGNPDDDMNTDDEQQRRKTFSELGFMWQEQAEFQREFAHYFGTPRDVKIQFLDIRHSVSLQLNTSFTYAGKRISWVEFNLSGPDLIGW